MHGRRSQKGKPRDPFSLTAALATALGDGSSPPHVTPSGSTEKIFDSSTGKRGPLQTSGEDSTTGAQSGSLFDLENGLSYEVRVVIPPRENMNRSIHTVPSRETIQSSV